MSELTKEIRDAQFVYIAAYVRQLDPTATDAAITRYLAEIEIMARALESLATPGVTHAEPFTAAWPLEDAHGT